jgi:hypothetical protein
MRYIVRRGLARPMLAAVVAMISLLFAAAVTATPPASAATELPDCHDWRAVQYFGRAGSGPLTVTGACRVPTPGHSVELRRHVPQGTNPAVLLLDRVLIEPTNPAAQVITEVPVRYTEDADLLYETVTILPDGTSIPVKRIPKE